MAKRPTSRSQADDTAAPAPGAPRPRRPRAPKQNAPIPPGAPVPTDEVRAAHADTNDEPPVNLDPGPRAESLDAVPSESSPAAWTPTEDDIRVRAYHRYLERGGRHGGEFDDWLQAEKDLKNLRERR